MPGVYKFEFEFLSKARMRETSIASSVNECYW